MTRDRKIIRAKAGPLELARRIGNVGKTGRVALLAAAVPGLLVSPAWGGEAALLAERILAAGCSDCLVFDTASRGEWAAEIEMAPEGKTGHAALDALNEEPGLESVRVFLGDNALLRFAGQMNVAAAACTCREAEGVERASPDVALGDGSDIAAARPGAVRHVIIDRAWGDCPSGCMHRETA